MPCLLLHFYRQSNLETDVAAKTADVLGNLIVDVCQRVGVTAILKVVSAAKIVNAVTTANAALTALVNKLEKPWVIPGLFINANTRQTFEVFCAALFHSLCASSGIDGYWMLKNTSNG